jgi:protein phosphatase
LNIAAFTHRGRFHPSNEDAIAIGADILTGDMNSPFMTGPGDCCLLAVANGMGGHVQGVIASRAALDYLVAETGRVSDPASCSWHKERLELAACA